MQANLVQAPSGKWRFHLRQAQHDVYSAAVYGTPGSALQDLRSWLRGGSHYAIYESIPEAAQDLLSGFIEQAVQDGWRNIRLENTSSDPTEIRIAVQGTSPSGEHRGCALGKHMQIHDLLILFGPSPRSRPARAC